MTGNLEHLKWESLKKPRRDSRLILLYKGLKGKASIPTDDLIPLVRRCRNHHSILCRFSTETCLTYLTDFIRYQNSKGLYTGMILLDLQKAFDTVDHLILCDKLRAVGVCSVDWFKSYLSSRYQFVQVNDTYSDSSPITCGVPQDSILGLLLFLCYVNDMEISISPECKLLLYADDSAFLFSHKTPEVIFRKLSSELQSCSKRLVDNKLSLHLFGSRRKLRKVQNFCTECNRHSIQAQTSVKYLGVNLDNFLSGEAIANIIIQKVNSRLKFLYRQWSSLNKQKLGSYYFCIDSVSSRLLLLILICWLE